MEMLTLDDVRGMLSSVPAIVALVIMAVDRAKAWLATTPIARVPIWLLASMVSAAATFAARYWLQTIEGDIGDLIVRAITLAAAGSGFREWWAAGLTKPMAASSGARRGE